MTSPSAPLPVELRTTHKSEDSTPGNEDTDAANDGQSKFIKRQPWLEFINIPKFGQGSLGLRNEDEIRLFEECDDKRLGG